MGEAPPIPTAGHPIGCKAAVVWAPGEKYKIEDIIVAPPRKNQVRIKILNAAVCHTDVTFSKLEVMAPLFPVILGHESAGVVESVGEGVENVRAGDHVLPFMLGQCGAQCISCKDDRSNMCMARPVVLISDKLLGDDEPHFTTPDGKIIHRLFGLSTFTEYTVVYKHNVVKISPEAPLEKVCLLPCGVGTGLGAVWKIAKVKPGSTVAVFGLGTIGLAVVEACRVAGASRIIGVDINASKFVQGKVFGLTDFINPKDHEGPLPEVIKELNEGGVDYSFECVGNVKLMGDAVESTQKEWGVTVILGFAPNPSEKFEIAPFSFLYGRSVFGTSVGGLRIGDLPELVERSRRKEFQLDAFVTHNLPFSRINEAVDLLHSGNSLRCVLHMGQ